MADSLRQFETVGRLLSMKLSNKEQEAVALIVERKYETHTCNKCKVVKTVGHFTASKRTYFGSALRQHSTYTCNECHIASNSNAAFLEQSVDWQERGSCVGVEDSEIFFPATPIEAKNTEHKYLQFCSSCPVREKCLQWGESTRSGGIWGGKFFPYASDKRSRAK